MKYFFDTEFIEGTQSEWFPLSLFKKQTKPTIDLISIGIVTEDDREYYAISKDFNIKEAWERFDVSPQTTIERYHQFSGKKIYWIRDNVLKPIWRELFFNSDMEYSMLSNKQSISFLEAINRGEYDQYFTLKSLQHLIAKYGKSNSMIAEEIKKFVYSTSTINNPQTIANWNEVNHLFPVDFYAYYCNYDWVAFCWLFGKMKDLPKGFPMYCRDLKQIIDEKVSKLNWSYHNHITNESRNNSLETIGTGLVIGPDRDATFEEKLKKVKTLNEYPKQETEHNALDDAKWNKELHEFLQKI